MTEKRLLAAIIVTFVVLASIYALITPVFEASDELWHYPMIKHLADGNPLPQQVFDPQLAGPWKQEASQPPLYYYLGAALTFWIDTSDIDQVRSLLAGFAGGVQKAEVWIFGALDQMNVDAHFQRSFLRGVFDSAEVVFFLTWTAFFLFLTVRSVEARRWRG